MSFSKVETKPTILLFLFVALWTQIFSQSKADTSFLAASATYAKNVYLQSIKGNAHLYNGSEHKADQTSNEEHPYFISDDWVVGSIVYDNELNENVGMMYDTRNDKVIIEHYSNKIELVSQKVSKFTLHAHTFVPLKPDSAKQIQEGFYDQLYNGNVKVYARRTKLYEEKIDANVVVNSYREKNKYFLLKDGKFYPVKSKSSILEVFSDKKKLLKQYLSKSQIRYERNMEKWMVVLTAYYDTLKD